MRTRLSVCARKARYRSYDDALGAARSAEFLLRPYYCDRCWQFHLTSRIKGKWMPRSGAEHIATQTHFVIPAKAGTQGEVVQGRPRFPPSRE